MYLFTRIKTLYLKKTQRYGLHNIFKTLQKIKITRRKLSISVKTNDK